MRRMIKKYPLYEECKSCNYYEDDGLYKEPNSCLQKCKVHRKKLKTRASKIFTNNLDAQVAFKEYCEIMEKEKQDDK